MTTIDPTGPITLGTIPSADTSIEQFRIQLRAVDPAELIAADRAALIDLLRQSIPE